MKQDSLWFIAMVIISGPLVVAIFIFFGQAILNFLKIPTQAISNKGRVSIIKIERPAEEGGKN